MNIIGDFLRSIGIPIPREGGDPNLPKTAVSTEKFEDRYAGVVNNMREAFGRNVRVNFHSSPINNASASVSLLGCSSIDVYSGIWGPNGLIRPDSDDEFAAILGHEMAHCSRYNQVNFLEYQRALIVPPPDSPGLGQIMAGLNSVLVYLSAVRSEEAEADRLGLELMVSADYDPQAMVDIWCRNRDPAADIPGISIFSDHPTNAERCEALRELTEE